MSRRRWLEPALLAVVAEGFLSRLSFGVIGFALPLYAHSLGMSLTAIGLLASLNTGTEILLKPIVARHADRLGLKRSLSLAIGARSFIGLFLSVASAPWQLLSIRTLQGAAESLRDPAINALIAEGSGEKSIASRYAWYSTAKSVAGSLGKATGGVLLTLTAANYPLVFLVGFALSALPLFAVLRYLPATPARPHADGGKSTGMVPAGATAAGAMPFVVLGTLISGTGSMLNNLFPVLATEYAGLSAAEAGIIYAISTGVVILAGPFFGWLSDQVSRKLVLMIRSAANTLSSALYIVSPSFLGVASAKVVDDIGKAAFRPAWGALMAHISGQDRSRRAHTMGLLSLGDNIGEVSGPLLAGFIWSTWGVTALLGTRAVLAVMTEVYAMTLARPPGSAPTAEREAVRDRTGGPATLSG